MNTDTHAPISALRIKLDRRSIPVILWNLTPLLGVLFLGWEPVTVFICYALETIVVGFFNVLKLLAVYKVGLPPQPGEKGVNGLGIIPFFLVHYFFFVAIQLSMFFAAGDIGGPGLFSFVHNIGNFMTQRSTYIALTIFIANNAFILIDQYLNGVFAKRSMMEQMFEPYPRIFVQQFVVILGSMLFALTGNGWPVLIIFIGIKMYADLLLKDMDLLSLARASERLQKRQERRQKENP